MTKTVPASAVSPGTKSDGSSTDVGSVDPNKAWGDVNRLQDLEKLDKIRKSGGRPYIRHSLKKGPPARTTRLIPLSPPRMASSPRRRGRGGKNFKLPIEAYPNQPDFKLNPTALEFSPGQSKLDPNIGLSPYAKPFTPDAQNIQLSPMAKPFTPIKDIGLSPMAKPFVPVTAKMPDFSLGASVKEIDFKESRKEQTAKINTHSTMHLEDFHTL